MSPVALQMRNAFHWLLATALVSATVATPAVNAQAQTPPQPGDLKSPNSLLDIPPGTPTAAPNDQRTIDDIMRSTVTSPSTSAPPAQLNGMPGELPLPELPPELKDHNKNKTINLGPLHTGPLIQIATLRPLRLDANYTEPVTLRDCLLYSLRNSLPIRINQQTFESNRYGFYGSLGAFLPSLSTNLNYTHNHIFPDTESNSRVYQESLAIPVFQGGRVFYGMLGQLYRLRASRNQYNASINDVLLNTYNAYYNLLLQRALLQIRIKSVEVSEAQLRLNEQLYLAGTGTRFAVMQSRTQLALDRQALLQQQVTVRQAALQLTFVMNMPLGVNVVPSEANVTEASLWDEGMGINELLNTSLVHRPELRQYEWLRLAAARNVQVASSALYPTAQWNISYTHSSTSINGPNNSPTAQLTAVNQQIVANRGSGSSSSSSSTSGSSSSSNSSSSASSSSSSSTSSTTAGASGGNVAGVGVFGGKFNTVSISFNLNWTLGNLGTTAAANILSARALARQALLQANQVLLQVSQQVRSSYLNALTAREQIDVTATGVASSAEELRLANLRVQMGVGTNLELIQAQRDYIQALINQAQAIIASNQAQAQLLHDTGLISVETLTRGYKRDGNNGSSTF